MMAGQSAGGGWDVIFGTPLTYVQLDCHHAVDGHWILGSQMQTANGHSAEFFDAGRFVAIYRDATTGTWIGRA